MGITVKCECGKNYRLKDELAGKRAKCTQCGKVMVIPRQADKPSEQGSTCPECRSELSTGAVFCVQCGLDLRTGKKVSGPPVETATRAFEREGKAIKKAGMPAGLLLGLIALGVAGIGAGVYFWVKGGKPPEQARHQHEPAKPAGESNASGVGAAHSDVAGQPAANQNGLRVPPVQPGGGLQGQGQPIPQVGDKDRLEAKQINHQLTYAQVQGGINSYLGQRVAWEGLRIAQSMSVTPEGKRNERSVYLVSAIAGQGSGDDVFLAIGELKRTPAAQDLETKGGDSGVRLVTGTIQGASDYKDHRGVTRMIPTLVDVVIDAPQAGSSRQAAGASPAPGLPAQVSAVPGMPPDGAGKSSAQRIARPGLLGTGVGVLPQVEMEKVNRRTKKVQRTGSADELVISAESLTGRNLKGQGFLAMVMFVPQVESLWLNEQLQQMKMDEMIKRMAKLKPNDVRSWNEALDKLCRPLGGGATDLETIGFLIQVDRFFNQGGFRAEESGALLARLGTLTPGAVTSLKKAIDCDSTQAAMMLIQHDGLFVQNQFQEQSLGKEMNRFK